LRSARRPGRAALPSSKTPTHRQDQLVTDPVLIPIAGLNGSCKTTQIAQRRTVDAIVEAFLARLL
jgi:uncharacterized protein (DUF2336 family)